MALVYNEIDPADVIIQVCSPEVAVPLFSFGGYMTSFGGVSFDTPTHEQTSHAYYGETSTTGLYALSGTSVIVQIPTPVEMITGEMRAGMTGFLEIGGVKYWCLIAQMSWVTGYLQIVFKMLTYDDGWTDSESLTITRMLIGGHCDFQALTMLDKFNSATGFGVGSRRIIKLMDGEYDDCPSMDMSSGGVTIKGLDRNLNPGRCSILKTLCQNVPEIYLGEKATLETTPNTRQIKCGPVSSIDGVSIVVNNVTTPAFTPPASGRNQSLNNIKIRDYSNNAYPVANAYTTIGTLIMQSEVATPGFAFAGLSADELCCITPRGLNLNTGQHASISNLICITIPGGSVNYAFSIGTGATDVRLGNVVCVSQSTQANSRLFYSPGTGATTLTASTMLIDGYGTYSPAGRTVGSVFVDKLAIRESFLAQLNSEVKYNTLVVIPDNEKIFLDKANFDFTVIHPVLLREGIGINKMPESIIRLGDKY